MLISNIRIARAGVRKVANDCYDLMKKKQIFHGKNYPLYHDYTDTARRKTIIASDIIMACKSMGITIYK